MFKWLIQLTAIDAAQAIDDPQVLAELTPRLTGITSCSKDYTICQKEGHYQSFTDQLVG